MKRFARAVVVVVILLVCFFGWEMLKLNSDIAAPNVPENIVNEMDTLFVSKMLAGEGAYGQLSGDIGPSYTDEEPRYMNSLLGGGNRLSVSISEDLLEVPGGKFEMSGKPIDIVNGPEYSYLLYGRESKVYYMPSKLAWDNSHEIVSRDFYLVRRENETGQGEIIEHYTTNNYGIAGSLQYKKGAGEIRFLVCGVVDKYVKVSEELEDNTHTFKLSCTGPKTSDGN